MMPNLATKNLNFWSATMCIDDLHTSRRDFIRLAALFTASGALPFLNARPALAGDQAANTPVKIGYLPITDATPLLVAHHNKLFEAEGIQVEHPVMFRSWAQLIEAFLAGQVNVIHLLSPMTVWARYGSKVPAKVVAWNHIGGSALTVAPQINNLKDLGGKQIAIPFWYSIHNVVLQHLLHSNGLNAVTTKTGALANNEVRLIVLAPSDMPPALVSGQIHGYIVAEPFNALAENLHIGKILRFTGDVWKQHACCMVFMHESDLNSRPEWSQKVVNAIVKAQLWTKQNRAATINILSKDGDQHYTPHSTSVLTSVLNPSKPDWAAYQKTGAIQHADWHEERIDFQPYPYPSYTIELIKRLKQTQVEGNNQFLSTLDPQKAALDLVDDRFVRKAILSVGGLKQFGGSDSFSRQEIITL
jgi:NitT/TauT family transport system substrate-binding protein